VYLLRPFTSLALSPHDNHDGTTAQQRNCLGYEQKKRLVAGAEHAARPHILYFLDKPTSRVGNQSPIPIVLIMKKLSQARQAIICAIPFTIIHQFFIRQFSVILGFNAGGNTACSSPVGENRTDVIRYFG